MTSTASTQTLLQSTPQTSPPTWTSTELARAFNAPKGFGDATLRDRHPDSIELLGGIPDPSVLPSAELAEATARVLSVPGVPALQYGRTEGVPALREWIAAREGVPVSRVLITNGGFHGISLAVQLVVERGGLVAVDNPIFPLFLRGLELSDARILPITVGRDGFDVAELEAHLVAGARPAAVYTVPDFHNPSQHSLALEGRRELVRLAERYDFILLADNPYRELRFRGDELDFEIFNSSSHVIHINTFTKTLGPGLRLGWIVLPERLVPDFVSLRARQDSHSSQLVQHAVAELLGTTPTFFDDTLASARELYRERADALSAALEAHAPGAFEIDAPDGGLFLWPRLVDDAIDADRLAEDASAEGIGYQRGSFFPSGPGTDAPRRLRLAYGDTPVERLQEAAARLGRALEKQ
ncbi:PLP-dependent aminotransferase family protein [Pseudoclavibacter sp. RFBI5]|uniref:aminotransferase-like domain-containing protein n=1 Tax=Pseudoclavibacter sp. RFBI5 TaxID=2080578 RepID=UPI000CE8DF07|nr:PLP-dependent aminotransferase family protein [Pseudoclavibacter sp. RFBI5]PPG01186.1 PLP-dependent aminotransferase family protein [Pseudoclavibacter sp. RFBI5]